MKMKNKLNKNGVCYVYLILRIKQQNFNKATVFIVF